MVWYSRRDINRPNSKYSASAGSEGSYVRVGVMIFVPVYTNDAEYDEKTNPVCVYIEPEAASIGLTEEQAKERGIDYRVGRFPMSSNGKALILNGGEGLVKIIADAKYGEVLGMHIIGPRATDLISEGALALRLEATVDELISTIHSHPTVTETLREAALNFDKRAIHTKN